MLFWENVGVLPKLTQEKLKGQKIVKQILKIKNPVKIFLN